MRAALAGCGRVGTTLGLRVLRAGHDLKVHERDRSTAAVLLDAGAVWAESARDAAEGCAVVVSALPGPEQVDHVARGADGLWSGAAPRTIHLETSTIGPALARELAAAARSARIRFLDAPLSRGAATERGAELVMWVGGDVNAFDDALPLIHTMSDQVTYCGRAGDAQITKLVNNLVTLSLTVVLGEALALGVSSGVSLETLRAALHRGTAQSRLLDDMLPESVFAGVWEPGLRLDLATKDLGLARELARDHRMNLERTGALTELYERASERGWGDLSAHTVVRLIEEATGVTLRSALADPPADGRSLG